MLVTHAERVLGLVDDGTAGSAMDMLILAAARLVSGLLGVGLGVIWLDTAVNRVNIYTYRRKQWQ